MVRTGAHADVGFAVEGSLGRVLLDRPRAINALTLPMIDAMHEVLTGWAADPAVTAVALEGTGDRGLCAGADVRAVRTALLAGSDEPQAFFTREYALDALVADFPKPYVAFMDGVVMGGGLGVSAHGSLRLVTERTRAAMPETGIGFFPDVGVLHQLSRAPGQTGTHLALTGATITAADAIAVGLADALVPAGTWPELLARLAAGEDLTPAVGQPAPEAELHRRRTWIDECYAGDDAATILDRLRTHPDAAAREAGDLLASRSPLSVAVTLEALRRASRMATLAEVLDQDRHLARTFLPASDFVEGVRAQLVDKDRRPRWRHTSLAEVTRSEVLAFFP